MFNPPITGNNELDAYLYDLHTETIAGSSSSSLVYDSLGGGGYLYRYISVKYADDNIGTGFSNTQTNKSYFGIHNTDSNIESTNPTDYTWYLVVGTFGTSKNLYYKVTGGRQVRFMADTIPLDYHWLLDNGAVIDLDLIVPSKTITFTEIMAGAVRELELAAGAVTAAKTNIAAIEAATGFLSANSVGTTQLANNAVNEFKIANAAITAAKTNLAALNATTGDLNSNTVGNLQIAANAVTAAKTSIAALDPTSGNLTANSVTANAIVAGAVTTPKIFAGAVTANELAADSVIANKIQAGAVVAGKIATDAVTSNTVVAGAIIAGKIGVDAVTASTIEAGAVTTGKIFAGAVTADRMTVSSLAAITANMGSITAGDLKLGTAEISGTTMTGTGSHLYSDGRLVAGSAAKNITWNNSALTINGDVVATGNIQAGAVSESATSAYTSTSTTPSASSSSASFTSPTILSFTPTSNKLILMLGGGLDILCFNSLIDYFSMVSTLETSVNAGSTWQPQYTDSIVTTAIAYNGASNKQGVFRSYPTVLMSVTPGVQVLLRVTASVNSFSLGGSPQLFGTPATFSITSQLAVLDLKR
jgi:hypothetical protein